MTDIKNILALFDPVSLGEMDNVKLMDRVDSKYAFREDELPSFLERMLPYYRILEVNQHRMIGYESLYFDTKDFDLFHYHHRGKLNRFKIRSRRYVESDLIFLEIKFKNNKNRTVKKRIHQSAISETISGNAGDFLRENLPMDISLLEAKISINFTRATLVHRSAPERVTLDWGLHFKNHVSEKTIDNLVIAEVKQDKAVRSEFVRMMKKHHVREGTLSKYCYGVASLFSGTKHNNFKPTIIKFNKLLYGTATGNQHTGSRPGI